MDDLKKCYCSAPIQKQCLKLIDLYMEEIIDMFVKDYTPEQVCAELHLCPPKVEEQIDNQINEVSSQVRFWISCKGAFNNDVIDLGREWIGNFLT